MSIHELAGALRRRQYTAGRVPKETIDALSDQAIVLSYITCSHCGRQEVPFEWVVENVGKVQSADGFFQMLEHKGHVH